MNDTPRPTVHPMKDLWASIADAQDAALAEGRSSSGVDPVPAVRGLAARLAGRRRRAGALVLALGAAAAGLAIYMHNAPLRVQLGRGGQSGAPGEALVADAQSDLPLLFSDGSAVTFRAGAAGRMQRLTAAGAELELAHGGLEAHVVHATSTLWLVHAGPYRVRVTGTRFTVDWVSPRLNVAVYEGSVVVDGGALGAGVPLRAGQHLTVHDGVVRTEPLPAGHVSDLGASDGVRLAARTGAAAGSSLVAGLRGQAGSPGAVGESDRAEAFTAPAADGALDQESGQSESDSDGADAAQTRQRSGTLQPDQSLELPRTAPRTGGRGGRGRAAGGVGAAHDRDWLPLAERGKYVEALERARSVGWVGLCARLDARRLLMLGDVARYAGEPNLARGAFRALVRRFHESRLAADAVFSLGRLAFEADQPREAAVWFRSYVRRWPSGPMANQAAGRLLECSLRMDDAFARAAARDYLARAPRGPHAPLANRILGEAHGFGSGPSGKP